MVRVRFSSVLNFLGENSSNCTRRQLLIIFVRVFGPGQSRAPCRLAVGQNRDKLPCDLDGIVGLPGSRALYSTAYKVRFEAFNWQVGALGVLKAAFEATVKPVATLV